MSSDGRLVRIPTERDGSSGGRVSAPSPFPLAAVSFGDDDAAVHGSGATTLCAWESMQNVLEPRSRGGLAGAAGVEPFTPKTTSALPCSRLSARGQPPVEAADGARATDDGVSARLEAPLREKRLECPAVTGWRRDASPLVDADEEIGRAHV